MNLNPTRVYASVWSDDFKCEVDFDCTEWFEQATEEDILALYDCGLRGDYPADDVARYCSTNNEEVRRVLDYATSMDEMGFEVEVWDVYAMDWLQENEPQIVRRIHENSSY